MVTAVGGSAVVPQVSCKVSYNSQSTEDSGRDLSGSMHNNFAPGGNAFKFKLQCVWGPQSLATRKTLLDAIYTGHNLSNMAVTFINPFTGASDATHYFMMGTPGEQELLSLDATHLIGMWNEFSVNFVEV